jgi:metallopeptidase family M12-like protein
MAAILTNRLALAAGTAMLALLGLAAAPAAGTADADQPRTAHVPLDPDADEADPVEETPAEETAGPDARVRPVSVHVVADDDYRDRYPHWRQRVKDTIERADNRLWDVFNIDLTISSIDQWNPNDPVSAVCGVWLDRLSNVGRQGADIVIGFTDARINSGGCAYRLGRYALVQAQGARADWIVVRHEVSHLFGAHDRYLGDGRPNPDHNDDLMELPYDHPHWWSAEDPDGDRPIIRNHAERFN